MSQSIYTWQLHARQRVIYCHQPDEVPRPPTSIGTDEDYWRNAVPHVPLTFQRFDCWQFEQNESPTLETALLFDEWQNLVRPTFVYPAPQIFDANDELHFSPATLSIDDLAWLNPVAPTAACPVPRVFADDDVIEIAPPIFGEDFWHNAVAPVAAYVPPLTFRDDEIIGVPRPLSAESDWWNTVAPIAATNFLRLPYLPDPDELPAGSLIGVVPGAVQGSGSIEGILGSGVATVPKISGSGQIRGVQGSGRID